MERSSMSKGILSQKPDTIPQYLYLKKVSIYIQKAFLQAFFTSLVFQKDLEFEELFPLTAHQLILQMHWNDNFFLKFDTYYARWMLIKCYYKQIFL